MTGLVDALYKRILLAAHPVGSIYQSTAATSPAELFGGTWEAIEGRFLLAAGGNYAAGSMGGEAAHTLTVNEMPSHEHRMTIKGYLNPNAGAGDWQISLSGIGTLDVVTESVGGGQPHNNMPPYMAVYMWRRTA